MTTLLHAACESCCFPTDGGLHNSEELSWRTGEPTTAQMHKMQCDHSAALLRKSAYGYLHKHYEDPIVDFVGEAACCVA